MIRSEVLSEIGSWLGEQSFGSGIEFELRERFPELHFTYCSDDDVISSHPVYEHNAFNLYLIDSSEHCLCFTQDMDQATGIVVAEIEDD